MHRRLPYRWLAKMCLSSIDTMILIVMRFVRHVFVGGLAHILLLLFLLILSIFARRIHLCLIADWELIVIWAWLSLGSVAHVGFCIFETFFSYFVVDVRIELHVRRHLLVVLAALIIWWFLLFAIEFIEIHFIWLLYRISCTIPLRYLGSDVIRGSRLLIHD